MFYLYYTSIYLILSDFDGGGTYLIGNFGSFLLIRVNHSGGQEDEVDSERRHDQHIADDEYSNSSAAPYQTGQEQPCCHQHQRGTKLY